MEKKLKFVFSWAEIINFLILFQINQLFGNPNLRGFPNPKITLALIELFQERTPKSSQKSGITNHMSTLYMKGIIKKFFFDFYPISTKISQK